MLNFSLALSKSLCLPAMNTFVTFLAPVCARAEFIFKKLSFVGRSREPMRIVFATLIVVLGFPSLASEELSPKALEFLKEIGVDADAPQLKSVLNDVIKTPNGEVASVEELAKNKNKTALLRFISTRNFVQSYARDQNTRLPATDEYESSFLTPEEKVLVQPAFRKAGDELYLRSLQQQKK